MRVGCTVDQQNSVCVLSVCKNSTIWPNSQTLIVHSPYFWELHDLRRLLQRCVFRHVRRRRRAGRREGRVHIHYTQPGPTQLSASVLHSSLYPAVRGRPFNNHLGECGAKRKKKFPSEVHRKKCNSGQIAPTIAPAIFTVGQITTAIMPKITPKMTSNIALGDLCNRHVNCISCIYNCA